MSDLIRREEAIDYFVTNIGIVDADGYAVDDYDERVKIWTERFSGIPSAEPEQVAKVEVMEKPNKFKCSECGQYFQITSCGITSSGSPVAYCPHCGCRLEWDE